MSAPNRPLNLGVQTAFTRLGLKGGTLPTMEPSGAVGVVVLGDLSHSLASELLEPRGGICFSRPPSFFGVRCAMAVQSLGAGGIVLERITLQSNSAGGVALRVATFNTLSLGASPLALIDLGGAPCSSIALDDVDYAGPIPADALQVFTPPAAYVDFPFQRIYVPAGFWLEIIGLDPGASMAGNIYFRELQSIQGGI